MKYYAVIDTNVIVSAFLKSNSIPDTLLDLVLSGVIIPLTVTLYVFSISCDEIITEYKEVLSRDKFGFGSEIVNDFINQIKNIGLYIDAKELDIELPDVKDKIFYEIVMEKRKTDEAYLVTGNIKHFPSKTFIVTPREMLEIIVGKI